MAVIIDIKITIFRKVKNVFFSIIIVVLACSSCAQKKNAVPPGELDIKPIIQPIPGTAKFINDTSYIWCGTLVKSHLDQKYHLFYSRWPRKYGMSAWVTSSEYMKGAFTNAGRRNGKMVALLCAVNENHGHSYNVQIPLKVP